MLYMVIVPIIPDYLRKIGAWETHEHRNPHGVIKDPVFHKETIRSECQLFVYYSKYYLVPK